jgi:hypothetical protein
MKLNQQLRRIEVSAFKIDKFIVFNNLKYEEGYYKLLRSIYIGILALKEDRFLLFYLKLSEIYCKDVFVRKTYTAFSPLIESNANHRTNISIMLSNMQIASDAAWNQRLIEGLFSRNKFEKSKVYMFIPP